MFGLSKTRNFGLDILRAIAILMVFIEHLDWGILNIYKPNSIFGILGVELFFVLSGFLIGGIVFKLDLETSKPSFKKFYFNCAQHKAKPFSFSNSFGVLKALNVHRCVSHCNNPILLAI